MEQLLGWLWDGTYNYGLSIILAFIAMIVLAFIYYRFQHELENIVKDTPSALLMVEASSGRLLLSNRQGMQLLGVRSIGSSFYYPVALTPEILLNFLDAYSSRYFQQQEFDWPLSESKNSKVSLSGRRTIYRGKRVWLVYAEPRQASDREYRKEIEKLSIAQSAIDSLSELIFVKDNNGRLIATNRAHDQFWQGRRDEADIKLDAEDKARSTKRRWTTDPQGRSCLLETHQSNLMSESGNSIGTLSISHDVTEWHKIQQNLRDEMERRRDTEVALAQRDTILQNILEASPDSIGIFNENMVYQACNKPFAIALGLTDVDDLIGHRLQDILPNNVYSRLSDTDSQVLHEGKSLRYIDKVEGSDGGYTWYDVVKSPFRDPASGTNGVLIMARDISERYLAEQKLEAANQELEKLSFMDSLTQVANRRRFDEQLHVLWHHHAREKLPLTVMLCDIDFFKGFNDHYGHQKGDEALIAVAKTFTQVVNRSSDCVARYGGEEFAVILPNTTSEGAEKVAQRIHDALISLALNHAASQISEHITISIGVITHIPQPHDDPEMAVALADSALYQAKANGRNQTCIHPNSVQ